MQQLEPLVLQLLRPGRHRVGSATSNSMLICGTVTPSGQASVPKQVSAACFSGQTPKWLVPAIFSLCQ